MKALVRFLLFACSLLPIFALANPQLLIQANSRSRAKLLVLTDGLGTLSKASAGVFALTLGEGIDPLRARKHLAGKGLFVAIRSRAQKAQIATFEVNEDGGSAPENEGGPGYKEAMEWYLRQRRDATGKVDWEALGEAAEHREAMAPGVFRGTGGKALRPTSGWEFIGPWNVTPPSNPIFFGAQAISGRVNATAFDPFDSNTFYAGAAYGGVLKSTDGGVNWVALTDFQKTLHVSSITMDAANQGTMYVGTGDYHGSAQAGTATSGLGYGQGIWKTTNGGLNWDTAVQQNSKAAFGNVAVSAVVLIPGTQILIVTTGRGQGGAGAVWRSADGGLSWTKTKFRPGGATLYAGDYSSASIGVGNGVGTRTIWIAGTSIFNAPQIYKSTTLGVDWDGTSTGFLTLASSNPNLAIVASKQQSEKAYLLAADGPGTNVYMTSNGGAQWDDIGTSAPNGSEAGFPVNFNYGQSFYNFFLETAPWSNGQGAQEAVFVGHIDVAANNLGGQTWYSIGGPTYSPAAKTHNDQHSASIRTIRDAC